MANYIKRVEIGKLDTALREVLETYATDVVDRVNVASKKAAVRLVKLTKETAPVGRRQKHYRDKITYSEDKRSPARFAGKTYVWHVKAPDYRLTHLLVHGHATRNGRRTRANPFLHNAVDTVEKEYVAKIEEAIKNG